jgi:Zn-dependent peptidase ImmA (M78 family)
MAIQPDILTWARETAGLSIEEAARAIGLKDARGEKGPERLAKLENGTEEPTSKLLEKMAKAYRRPLVVFYLRQPPKTGDRGQDFRSLPGAKQFNPDLDALIRDISARQELVHSILEDEEMDAPDFVGTVTVDVPVGALAKRIVKSLAFDLQEFRRQKAYQDAFEYLRTSIEGAGVFVLLLGNLGSHHTNIPVEIFRGFASADRLAPMIVINDQDAKAAWSFTALHELVHLWLGATGVSGSDTGDRVERYCNDVAGEILVGSDETKVFGDLSSFARNVITIGEQAREWRVSRQMVAYKLFRAGKIGRPMWNRLRGHFQDEYIALKQKESEKQKATEGGPNYYVVKRHRVGPALLGLVRRALDDGNITYTKASRVLGVKPRNVEPLLSSVSNRSVR